MDHNEEFALVSVKEEPEEEQPLAVQEFLSVELKVEEEQELEVEPLNLAVTRARAAWSQQDDTEKQFPESWEADSRLDARRDCESGSQRCGGDGASVQLRGPSQTLECADCSAEFVSKYSLIRHVFSHMDGVPPPSDVCELCGEVFPSAVCLGEHSEICQGYEYETLKTKCQCGNVAGGQCEFCQRNLVQFASLERQLNTQIIDKTMNCLREKPFPHLSHLLADKSNCKDIMLKCDVCGKSFSSKSRLCRHKRRHTADKKFKCKICVKTFLQAEDLRRHVRCHTGETPYKCDNCGMSFSRSGTLKRHELVHKGEKPHKCEVCGKSFSESRNILNHKCLHTGETPYKCEICGMSFSRSGTLQRHKLSHTGEKRFKCEICGNLFSRSATLQRHKLSHTGEKPYKCKICGKTFSQSGNVQIHMRVHTGEKPHKCEICSKTFSEPRNLQNHKLVHTRETV